tara:strand:+ start:1112 stop:1534 length:423 start_codon:yes stop_codon:yes gene_type:complete
MADTKVSDLAPLTFPSNNDILYIVKGDAGTSNRITFNDLLSGTNGIITNLNDNVNLFTAEVRSLSGFYITLNLTNFVTDFAVLSSQVKVLSAETEDLWQTTEYAETAYTKITVLTGGLTQSITTAGGTLNFINGVLQSVT